MDYSRSSWEGSSYLCCICSVFWSKGRFLKIIFAFGLFKSTIIYSDAFSWKLICLLIDKVQIHLVLDPADKPQDVGNLIRIELTISKNQKTNNRVAGGIIQPDLITGF